MRSSGAWRTLAALAVVATVACSRASSTPSATAAGRGTSGRGGSSGVTAPEAAGTSAPAGGTSGVAIKPTDAGKPPSAAAGTTATQDDAGLEPSDAGLADAAVDSGGAGRAGESGALTAAGGGGAGGQAGAFAADGGGGSGGSAGQAGSAGRRGLSRRCRLPSTCAPVDSLAVTLAPCCIEGNQCGYEITRPDWLREQAIEMADGGTADLCNPASKIFTTAPGQPEERVLVDGGTDQLITPDCESRHLLAFTLVGCCLPNDQCGISTYQVADILAGLVLFPAPFTRVECVSVEEMNAQFRASSLAGFGQIPPSNGTCKYADLDARLK